jgi:hypothetical protein
VSPNRSNPPEFTLSWQIFAVLGLVFLVVGGASLFAPLFPLRIGVIEWEFGTASEFFDNVPIFGLGLGFLMAPGWPRVPGAGSVPRAGVYFSCTSDVADSRVVRHRCPPGVQRRPFPKCPHGDQEGGRKNAVQILVYPVGFLWMGIWSWRRTLSRH